jgi:pantoate--beta-alanine ligase
MLELVASIQELRRHVGARRQAGATIGFVPTMGALHAGHARLMERARAECAEVVVSVFINPLQFDRKDDLDRYPRTLDADVALCRQHGVDTVFAPSVEEIYPAQPMCEVEVHRIADHLCGAYRPGHFRGVATVVLKLLQIAQPDVAYFGEKDAQQLAVIRRMVADFNVPVRIVGVETVREADGLALSSRNQRLTADERLLAPVLYRALRAAADAIERGETDPAVVTARARAEIPDDPALRLEYLEVVDPDEMQPVARIRGPVTVAGALWVGGTRLIDNVTVGWPGLPGWPTLPGSSESSG